MAILQTQDSSRMPSQRQGDWMQTSKSRMFWPLDPRVGDFDIEEIAHALSNLCRFGGHVREFYSVAQHCVLVSNLCAPENAREGLMHDAAEAYIVDIPRPIKYAMPEYLAVEARMEIALAAQYQLNYPWPTDVKRADNVALMTEARDLLGVKAADWEIAELPAEEHVFAYSPRVAERFFLERWEALA